MIPLNLTALPITILNANSINRKSSVSKYINNGYKSSNNTFILRISYVYLSCILRVCFDGDRRKSGEKRKKERGKRKREREKGKGKRKGRRDAG